MTTVPVAADSAKAQELSQAVVKSGAKFSRTSIFTGTSTVSVPAVTFTTKLNSLRSVESKGLSSLIFPFLLMRKYSLPSPVIS